MLKLDTITVFKVSANPVSYVPQSYRLLDQLRDILRYKHHNLRTEEVYLYWVKFLSVGMGATHSHFPMSMQGNPSSSRAVTGLKPAINLLQLNCNGVR
jgi:hypothetical protein